MYKCSVLAKGQTFSSYFYAFILHTVSRVPEIGKVDSRKSEQLVLTLFVDFALLSLVCMSSPGLSPAPASTKQATNDAFMSQRNIFSRRRATPVKKKKKAGKKGSRGASPRAADEPLSSSRSAREPSSVYDLDADQLREEILARDLEIAELRGRLREEEQRTDKMERTADVALRALDSHLADGKWSTVVSPPDGSLPGSTFQWADMKRGINATAVTVPDDWGGDGPVLVRLHRTPVAPRLPAPALEKYKSRPMQAPFGDISQHGALTSQRGRGDPRAGGDGPRNRNSYPF